MLWCVNGNLLGRDENSQNSEDFQDGDSSLRTAIQLDCLENPAVRTSRWLTLLSWQFNSLLFES